MYVFFTKLCNFEWNKLSTVKLKTLTFQLKGYQWYTYVIKVKLATLKNFIVIKWGIKKSIPIYSIICPYMDKTFKSIYKQVPFRLIKFNVKNFAFVVPQNFCNMFKIVKSKAVKWFGTTFNIKRDGRKFGSWYNDFTNYSHCLVRIAALSYNTNTRYNY